jgi:hypothetical protein
MKKALALVAVAGIAGVASAQSATMTVTANGSNAVNVNPGDSVTINAELSWTGAVQFAGVKGAIRVDGNAGAGSNFTSDFPAGLQVLYGAFNGGSREGLDFAVTPALFTGGQIIPPSGNSAGVTIGNYTLDTTGMAAGTYNVGWAGDTAAPNVRLYLTTTSPGFVEAQSTFVGATITVVPAPASLALVGLGGLVAGRRRR